MDNPIRANAGTHDDPMPNVRHGVDEPWWSQYWHDLAEQRDPVIALAATRGFVLTSAELSGLGVTRAAVRTRIAHGEWTAAGYGFVAPLAAPTPRHRHALAAAAAAQRRRFDAISGRTAAVLHALPTMGLPDVPRLTIRDESLGRMRSSAAQCFTGWLGADEITSWYGVAVTNPARTLVDLARHDRFDAIMAADEALRLGLVTAAAIEAALANAVGWPGVRQAREVLTLADARAESPLESVTRLRLHDDGFPTPKLQYPIGGYWVDFCWPQFRLVLEVDGRVKYGPDAGDVLWEEKRREVAVRRHGYRVERVIASDIYAGWPRTSAYLRPLMRLPRRVG